MTYVTHHGPIFDGRAAAAVHDFCDDFEQKYAERVKEEIQSRLRPGHGYLTGNYSRHIQVVRSGTGEEVNDSGIIYGPWLEGVGSRNRTTRFKGYFTFRQVGQKADAEAGRYANDMLDHTYLRRMQ